MSKKETGGMAFPIQESALVGSIPCEHGMTLRDWFAGMAISGKADCQGFHPEVIKDAYAIADALLEERKK